MGFKVSSAGRLVLGIGIFLMAILTGLNIMFTNSPLAGIQQGLIFYILAAFVFVEWAYEGKQKVLDLETYKNPISVITLSVVLISIYFGTVLSAYNQIAPGLVSMAAYLAFILGIIALIELFN